MRGFRARLRRLETQVRAWEALPSPADAWVCVVNGKGDPVLFDRACRPLVGQLQDAMMSHARRVLEARRSGLQTPDSALSASALRLLGEIITYEPGEVLPEELLRRLRRGSYDPDEWHRLSRNYDPEHLFGYNRRYRRWVTEELAWSISPDYDARALRERFWAAAGLDPAAHQDDHLLPLHHWPEGLFGLLGRHFHDPKSQQPSG